MKRILCVGIFIGVIVFNLSGCAIDSGFSYAYREPRYVIPGNSWYWQQYPREGWGWFHGGSRGWHRGWR